MTTTPPDAPDAPTGAGEQHGPHVQQAHHGPRTSREEVKDLGRLRRSAGNRKVAGVAGGLARHLDIDPLVLRVAFVVLAFFGGAGLILYGACWLLVPDETTNEAPVTLDERSRTVALLVVGVLAAFALIGDSWGYFWFPWPLAVIALVVFWVLNRRDRAAAPPGSGGAPYWPPHAAQESAADAPAGVPGAGPDAGTETPVAATYTYAAPTYSYASTAPAYAPARESRRRGPKLFWFTLALVALGIGLLGTADVAGARVADSAYPALAVGTIGVMLLVGAFFGRAGGLVLVGLIATVGLAGVTAADTWESEGGINEVPRSAAAVQPAYAFGVGELELDLAQLEDLEGLDGRVVRLEGGLGSIDVIVPDGVDVKVQARVGGPGSIELFGDFSDGIDIARTVTYDGGTDVPELTIVVELGFGEINVRTDQ